MDENDHINHAILLILFLLELFLYKFSVAKAYKRQIYQKYNSYPNEKYPWYPGKQRNLIELSKDAEKYQQLHFKNVHKQKFGDADKDDCYHYY